MNVALRLDEDVLSHQARMGMHTEPQRDAVLRATIFFVVVSACVPIRSAAQTGPAVPGGQVPMDATLSMLVQVLRMTGRWT